MKRQPLMSLILILAGISIGIIFGDDYLATLILAASLVTTGCYLWVKRKNRHWAHMLLGLLGPIGLIWIWRLKTYET